MSKNIENIAKRFEETCEKTDILNESIGSMTQVLTAYNKTLGNINRNNKIKEIVEFGKNIEERIENVEIYNSKLVMESINELVINSVSELNAKSEERLKKFIRTQIANNKEKQQVGLEIPNDLSENISMLLENQTVMMSSQEIMMDSQDIMKDELKTIKNDTKLKALEIKLNNANATINKMKTEQARTESYYESKISNLERELFRITRMVESMCENKIDSEVMELSEI